MSGETPMLAFARPLACPVEPGQEHLLIDPVEDVGVDPGPKLGRPPTRLTPWLRHHLRERIDARRRVLVRAELVAERRCIHCAEPIPDELHPSAITCSKSCRAKAYEDTPHGRRRRRRRLDERRDAQLAREFSRRV